MTIKIPVYKPFIGPKEKEYVNKCLDTGWVSSKGPYVEKFESNFAEFIGINHAISVSNGTVALHIALKTLGIGDGDEVIVPSFTYIASVNAITYCNAKPVFCDSEPIHWQIDPLKIEEKITPNTKAILLVHLYGHPCDLPAISNIASKHNLFIIEDCAESFGSKYTDKMTGTLGDISTFSFFGNKTITTGEGGMVVTQSDKLAKLARKLKGQGLHESTEYWHDIIGYNYRMTNICAAIGCAQLEIANELIHKKRQIAFLYKNNLAGLPFQFHEESEFAYHTYWMNSILLDNSSLRNCLRQHLSSCGIETRPFFSGVHGMPMYFDSKASFPVCDSLASAGINLPSYPDLSTQEIDYVSKTIRQFFASK